MADQVTKPMSAATAARYARAIVEEGATPPQMVPEGFEDIFADPYSYDPMTGEPYESGVALVAADISSKAGWVGPGGTPTDPIGGTTVSYNGIDTGYDTGITPGAVQTGFPIAAVVASLGLVAFKSGAKLMLGFLKQLYTKYGASVLKFLIGAAAFKEFLDLIGIGAPDESLVTVKRGRKRYSIGANPRLNTLLKVGKYVDNLMLRTDRRIRKFRSRLRGYAPRGRTRYYSDRFLSPVERKLLK